VSKPRRAALAKARLDAGAGVQWMSSTPRSQLLTAQSTRLQALFGYNSSWRNSTGATGAQSTYTGIRSPTWTRAHEIQNLLHRSAWNAEGKPKTR